MKRENVLVSEDALARQREFEAKIKEMFTSREAHPVACVDTFGCQQNVADGQKLMGMLADSGFTFTEDPKEADLVILNTCAVREHAEQRVFGNLGILTHTKKENPEQVICLCGCMAQEERVSQRVKESYRHVDLVFGPHALWKFPELLWQVYETRKRVFAVDNEDGTIAEGIPVVREKGVKAVSYTHLDVYKRQTCESAGRLEIRYRNPRKNTVKVLLLMDSGGSMAVSYTHLDVYKRQVYAAEGEKLHETVHRN